MAGHQQGSDKPFNPYSHYSDAVTGIPFASHEQNHPQPSAPAPFSVQSEAISYGGGAGGGIPQPWSTGLCGCFDDVGNCCLTMWCPCVTFGRIAEVVDRGSSSCGVSGVLYTLIAFLFCGQCVYSCFYRTKMRGQYQLKGGSCVDCLTHCCCEECALCQEYRELKNRGFDMTIGWQANVEKQTRGVANLPPSVYGGMSR